MEADCCVVELISYQIIIFEYFSDIDLCRKGLTSYQSDKTASDTQNTDSQNDDTHLDEEFESSSCEITDQCAEEIEQMKAMGLPVSFLPESHKRVILYKATSHCLWVPVM